MEAASTNETDATGHSGMDRVLDRSLTIGGYTPSGQFKSSTQRVYAFAWSEFVSWCGSMGLTSMPATSETLATYAAHLSSNGYATSTVRTRIVAIRARHRIQGHSAPDNVAAWSVLRAVKPTRPPRPPVKGIKRTDLLAAVNTCGQTTAGLRNRALALLAWDLTVPATSFIALDIEHITIHRGDRPAEIRIPGRRETMRVDHDHDPVDLCPVCAVQAWIAEMAQADITRGPLFRPVDRLGVIEGAERPRAGVCSPTGSARLSQRSVYRVWARLVAASGISASTPRALRIGGARDRVQHTGDLGSALDRAGWMSTTGTVVSRLVLD